MKLKWHGYGTQVVWYETKALCHTFLGGSLGSILQSPPPHRAHCVSHEASWVPCPRCDFDGSKARSYTGTSIKHTFGSQLCFFLLFWCAISSLPNKKCIVPLKPDSKSFLSKCIGYCIVCSCIGSQKSPNKILLHSTRHTKTDRRVKNVKGVHFEEEELRKGKQGGAEEH